LHVLAGGFGGILDQSAVPGQGTGFLLRFQIPVDDHQERRRLGPSRVFAQHGVAGGAERRRTALDIVIATPPARQTVSAIDFACRAQLGVRSVLDQKPQLAIGEEDLPDGVWYRHG
jgi:hypothetical protein